MEDLIRNAIQVLRSGGIVIFPTDTAFGIGCRMDDQKAVDRLFIIRKRPLTQATPVLVSSDGMALAYYLDPSQIVRRLMKQYWPGALTIIARCKKELVYSPIRGGGETIGLRMPNHEAALGLIRGVGVPILGPSANFSGHPTPFRLEDLDPELVKLVDFVLPGDCTMGNVSTVVDCSIAPYRIVRQGAVNDPMHRDKKVLLHIDTSDRAKSVVGMEDADGVKKLEVETPLGSGSAVLTAVQKLLADTGHSLKDVTGVQVATGPGSYTGLRVGVAIANMLGELLGVSVNGLPVGQTVTPVYEGDRW